MEYGKNTFTIEYAASKIKEFEKKILALGVCKSLLPMSFVSFGQTEQANYDCSEYQSLDYYEIKSSKELIELIEKCVFALMQAGSNLINPRKFELTTKTVFYSDAKKEIKLAYVPKEVQAEKATHVFVEFLKSLENDIENKSSGRLNKNEMIGYLREIISCIESKNRSLFDIINYLGEVKQEIHACG